MSDQRWIIPESLFVGLAKNVRGRAPLASLTGAGTDSGAKSRMQTVTNNSKITWTLDNTPQWGMTLGGSAWKDEIRVEDPRGFSVNVRMDAVLDMMKECAVVNGVIQAACVWARSDGKNVLLAVGSETHDLAQLQTRLAHSKVSLKNVQLGDWVTLNNGVQGVYLGKFHKLWFESSTWISSGNPNKLRVDDTARVVLWQPVLKRSWKPAHTQCVMFLSNAVVAEHVPGECTYTDAQAEIVINQLLQDDSCYVQRTSRGYYSEHVLMATRKPVQMDKLQITPEPIVYTNSDEINMLSHKVHWSPDGVKFWMWASQNKQATVNLCEWDTSSLQLNELKFVTAGKMHNNSASQCQMDVKHTLQNLYVFKATYTSTLANTITVCI